jgi:hypothetical protein
LIKDCQTKEELLPLKKHIKPEQQSMYWDKWNELNAKEVHSSEVKVEKRKYIKKEN